MEEEEFPVLKYTVQLYYSPITKDTEDDYERDPPMQIASGVLIKNASKFFLLTCKHVFDNIKVEDVVILTSWGFAVRLPNEVQFINNDSIDLALIRLKAERVAHLKAHYSFLPKKNLGFAHVFDEDLWYMLFGFINKRTTLKSKAFYVESFGFLTGIRQYKKIEKIGFNYDNNITLEYNRRKQGYFDSDLSSFGYKELKGLSGGGIWLSVAGKKANTYNYLLVGIMIEERIDRGFLIGTKIGLIEGFLS
jgi:hypothetical protein